MPAELPLVASPIIGGDPRRLDSADALARWVAKQLGLDHPVRERVSMNAVYRCGSAVIRVSRPTVDPIVAIDTAHISVGQTDPDRGPVRGSIVSRPAYRSESRRDSSGDTSTSILERDRIGARSELRCAALHSLEAESSRNYQRDN